MTCFASFLQVIRMGWAECPEKIKRSINMHQAYYKKRTEDAMSRYCNMPSDKDQKYATAIMVMALAIIISALVFYYDECVLGLWIGW